MPSTSASAGTSDDASRQVRDALDSGRGVAIWGVPGSGRTTLVERSLQGRRHVVGHALATLVFRPFLTFETALGELSPSDEFSAVTRWVEERTEGLTLVAEDLHLAHPATIKVLGHLVGRRPVVLTVAEGQPRSHAVADALDGWGELAPARVVARRLDEQESGALLRRTAPTLGQEAVERIVAGCNGNPAWLIASARRGEHDPRAAAVLTDLTIAGRTALIAAALLARPAEPSLLGFGVDELIDRGLAWIRSDGTISVVEVVAGAALTRVGERDRAAVHSRLADLLAAPAERSRHLAAAGRTPEAVAAAVAAADSAPTAREAAAHRHFAATLHPEAGLVVAAAEQLLRVCDLQAAGVWLDRLRSGGPDGNLLAAQILRYRGDSHEAAEAVRTGLSLAEPGSRSWRRLAIEAVWSADKASLDRVGVLATDACGGTDEEACAFATAAAASLILNGDRDGSAPDLDLEALGAPEMFHTGLVISRALLRTGDASSAAGMADAVAMLAGAEASNWAGLARVEAAWCRYLLEADPNAVDSAADMLGEVLSDEARDRARALLHLSLVDRHPTVAPAPDQPLHGTSGAGEASAALWAAVAAEARLATGDLVDAATDAARAGLPRADPVTALLAGPAAVAAAHRWGTTEAELQAFPLLEAEAAALGSGDAADLEAVAEQWRRVALRGVARCLLAVGTADTRATVAELSASNGLARWAAMAGVRRTSGSSEGPLTDREHEVLELIGAGCTTPAIARRLGIAESTVETHVKHAKMKLGVTTRAAAVATLS